MNNYYFITKTKEKIMTKTTKFLLFSLVLLLSIITQAHAALKSINDFTKDMNRYPGYFTFFYDDSSGNLYLKLDKLNYPFLLQQSLPNGLGSNDIGLDRGQLGETRLVQFEKMGAKVMLRQLNTYYRANTKNKAEKLSIEQAFASSILHGFDLVAKTDNSLLIDYTPYLLSDVHGVTRKLKQKKQGAYSLDSSRSAVYMPRSKSFLKNTELEAVLTFKGSMPGEYVKQAVVDPYAISLNLHHSLVELPDNQYQPRKFHPGAGYWSVEHKNYAATLSEDMKVRYIPRHRLIKKDPNSPVSEAVEPIIYYLDPGVPEPVRTALIEGASWWSEAFDLAGFKNAFQVKMLPEHADPMDIRYNVIQWVHRATRGWSYGSSVIDPRTGEIIKGHVTLGSLRVRQDILIAEALAAPFKRGDEVALELENMALNRIRQLSAHEVGHTLGIAHNFSASVKDRASVMDYPHPLVTLNEEGSLNTSKGYDLGLGIWDKQVIKYGYSQFGVQNENKALENILKENQDLQLEFISDPDARSQSSAHPTAHLWDNGQDPVDELSRMLSIRQKALAQFGIENIKNGTALSQLEEVLIPLYLFHRFQVQAVAKLIGGTDYSYEVRSDDKVKGVKFVTQAQQQAALSGLLATLNPEVLTLSESILSIIPPKAYGEYKTRESIIGRTGINFDAMALPEVAINHSLTLLLNSERLNRVQQQSMRNNKLLNVAEILNQLDQTVFKSKNLTGLAQQIQQRLQFLTARNIATQIVNQKVAPEVQAQLKFYLKTLALELADISFWQNNAAPNNQFKVYLAEQINVFLTTAQWPENYDALKLPPGSPI